MVFGKRTRARALVGALAALAALVPASTALAGTGTGGGGVPSGGGVGPQADVLYLLDNTRGMTPGDWSPPQGWGDDSITYAISQIEQSFGASLATKARAAITSSCKNAIANAIADTSHGRTDRARVVGVAATISGLSDGTITTWGDSKADFAQRFNANWDGMPVADYLRGWQNSDIQHGREAMAQRIQQISGDPSNVCLAYNSLMPPTKTPPPAPGKDISRGTSADGMVNTTTITSRTGTGGSRMVFTDRIDAHGVAYTVGNYHVTDENAPDADITASFDYAHQGDTVTATWKGGALPTDHEFRFSFDATVHDPDNNHVWDQGSVTWDDQGTGETDGHDYPTWRPDPDKSWILRDTTSGAWRAVVDPDRTNATGGDNKSFLDGDQVGSVVNGTVAADLAQAPSTLGLTDDWSKASYLFKAAKASQARVYEADAASGVKSSVADIANRGRDVTDRFTITIKGTKATAVAKASYLGTLRGLAKPKQLTLLIPGAISFAHGQGAAQVRSDFGKAAGEELTFCTNPDGSSLTNTGSERVNSQTVPTNEPKICGYVPPVKKDVVGEAGQGGDQASIDGKVVWPGQRVEYQLTTQPHLPDSLAYAATSVSFTDQWDPWLEPDTASVELMDLSSGTVIPKTKYTTAWDTTAHQQSVTFTDPALIAQWHADGAPRLQERFTGTLSASTPAGHRVANQWMLGLNHSLTPSNRVFNPAPDIEPSKADDSSHQAGVSIDGKTLLLGDTGVYRITIDARRKDTAYLVWRLGMVDAYDSEYLRVDPADITITGADGLDYTKAFNIQIRDGVAYAFAKTVDTRVPATGRTIPGNPQPTDLRAYSQQVGHDALGEPAIDQGLLGQTYTVNLPYTVIKADDGHTVSNTATQISNDVRQQTNEVSNPLAPINPSKDVVVKVGGKSVGGHSIWLNSAFLYQLDSSIPPAGRAYPAVDQWRIADRLNAAVDHYTGQWAVYATRDLKEGGRTIAAKGARIAGSGFDATAVGGALFTLSAAGDGTLTVAATDRYRSLVSAMGEAEVGWRAYVQCTRTAPTDRQENAFTEHYQDKTLESNLVWTRTPNLTPSLSLRKWDTASGPETGHRPTPAQALHVAGSQGTDITFTITNTSADEQGHGALFRARDLKLEDATVAGDGRVVDLTYPEGWDTLVLKPGQSVDVHGTMRGMGEHHTDRARVSGTPLTPCPTDGDHPFDKEAERTAATDARSAVNVDGVAMCADTQVASQPDDWNAEASALPLTGGDVATLAALAILLVGAALGLQHARRRHQATGSVVVS